jgi:hypothetical protein
MRRKKRLTIIRIGLALAVAAVFPATALAKPEPSGPGEIPYLSQGHGVNSADFSGVAKSPDDRSFARSTVAATQPLVIPYMSHGVGVTSAELGYAFSNSPDDRAYQRPITENPVVVDDGGSTIDVNPFTVTGFGLALLLLAGGMGLVIRHNRKTTRLSPA